MDQTWSNWFKLDQTWTNWIRLDRIGSNWIKLDQLGSTCHKLDQIGINWIKLDQIVETWGWGLVPHPYLILLLFIFDYWKTWLKLVMLENLQACLKFSFEFEPWKKMYVFCKCVKIQMQLLWSFVPIVNSFNPPTPSFHRCT